MRRLISLVVTALLGACAIGGNPPATAPAMPVSFAEPGDANAAALTADWWRSFGSSELLSLINAAEAANPDLAIAAERVRQAEAQVSIADASLFPALNLGVGTSRRASRPSGGGTTSTVPAVIAP